MNSWLKSVLGVNKPIIAMCHLLPLPGDPYYDQTSGMDYVIEMARKDLTALIEGGVDAIMFSNEFSLPYLTNVETVTVAAMARIIGELKPDIKLPFGVNVLWDAEKSLDLAAATGALFVREIFSGVYGSDFGLWDTNVGKTVRHQFNIGAGSVKLLFNIAPEAAQYLTNRTIDSITKSTVFNSRPDALCVSGLTAGVETEANLLRLVKETSPDTVVFANTGVNLSNYREQLTFADGAIIGTAFKHEGKFENHVDRSRVKLLMDEVKQFRVNQPS